MKSYVDYIIVGCGLTGSVIARELAEKGKKVLIWEQRNHIGGNMYDYVDDHGFLVQKYGPHIFHTNKEYLFNYLNKYCRWKNYKVICGAVIDGKYTPTPFNFTTIDTFYCKEKAEILKKKINKYYGNKRSETVLNVLKCEDSDIRDYAEFLVKRDYAPYTAKQWGMEIEEVDPNIFSRVPLRFSYDDGYYDDQYQVLPLESFKSFFDNLLEHRNINVELNVDRVKRLRMSNGRVLIDNFENEIGIIYTGAVDELFSFRYGNLPYRSLKFEWKYSEKNSFQNAPIVAYPMEEGFTRITEYKKLPYQNGHGTSYALEYPLKYVPKTGLEPYYPVSTQESQKIYFKYKLEADKIRNLTICGRLGDFKYYNMDQALERALEISNSL